MGACVGTTEAIVEIGGGPAQVDLLYLDGGTYPNCGELVALTMTELEELQSLGFGKLSVTDANLIAISIAGFLAVAWFFRRASRVGSQRDD